MNTLKGIIAGIVAVIIGIWGYTGYQKAEATRRQHNQLVAYQNAIISVYNHRTECLKWLSTEVDRVSHEKWWSMGTPDVLPEYVRKLACANTASCPQDFQHSWLVFVGTQRDIAENADSTQGWIAWTKNYFTLGMDSIIPAIQKMQPLERAAREAELNMQLCAQTYGLKFDSGLEKKK
jgi:hypothetical protein